MNVINVEHTYKNGVVVQLDKRDRELIENDIKFLDSHNVGCHCPTVRDLVKWILLELED